MVTLTVDGRAVTVPRGTTILEAAEKLAIKIPSLCHDKRLVPFGACRLCVVELKGREGKLLPACFNPAREGMEVLTASAEVIESRRIQLQLILLHHPLECPTCDQAGACTLQDLVYEYGITDNPFRLEKAQGDSHPALKEKLLIGSMARSERQRCILCGRCVRICEELQGVKEIDFIGRGFKTIIGTSFEGDLRCELCGQCVSTCPVGALTTSLITQKARHWELKKCRSICAYCGCGCSVLLGVKDNRVRTVISEYSVGSNQGNLCVKGRYGWEFIHSEERLRTPLLRKNGTLTPCSWDQALEEIAGSFKKIREEHGADAIGAICSGRLSNEEAYLLQKLMRAAVGTNNIDTSARFTYQGLMGLQESLGYPAMTNSIGELREADVIMALRSDPQETHPLVKIEVIMALNRNRAWLIAANSYETWLHTKAHASIIYRPGTEVALLNGMMQVVFEEKLEDKEFMDTHTQGSESLRSAVAPYDPSTVEGITGVPSELLITAARKYAGAKRASILISSGLGLRGDERGIALAACNLALITGHMGKPSTGVNILAEKNNSQGVLDMGVIPEFLPGYRHLHEPAERRTFERAWDASLSTRPGLNALDMLRGAETGLMKALYCVGENPLSTYPDSNQTMRALHKADLVVVQDLFLSETARYAHVLLPALSFAEKEGTFTNTERRVQKYQPALEYGDGAKSDFEIITALAQHLGYAMGHSRLQQVLEEISTLVPFYGGIAWNRIADKGIQWPCSSSADRGSPFLYADGFPRGKAFLRPVTFVPPREEDEQRFPLYLVTVHSLFHSGSLSLRSRGLKELSPEGFAELNAHDADRLQIESGDRVIISSARGNITVPAIITGRTPPGRVLLPYHFERLRVNELTDKELPLTRVAIEKA